MLLLAVEFAIALFVRDTLIRPFFGDVLVVILIFTFIKSFLDPNSRYLALGVFVFASLVEMGQYFDLVHILGLGRYYWARVLIGTTFAWSDIAAYAFGAIASFLISRRLEQKST